MVAQRHADIRPLSGHRSAASLGLSLTPPFLNHAVRSVSSFMPLDSADLNCQRRDSHKDRLVEVGNRFCPRWIKPCQRYRPHPTSAKLHLVRQQVTLERRPVCYFT
jgi:hypothetical protein